MEKKEVEVEVEFSSAIGSQVRENGSYCVRILGIGENIIYLKSIEEYKELIKLNPNNPWNYIDLSKVYRADGDIKTAIEVIKEGIRKNINIYMFRLHLVNYLEEDKQYMEALTLCIIYLEMEFYKEDKEFIKEKIARLEKIIK